MSIVSEVASAFRISAAAPAMQTEVRPDDDRYYTNSGFMSDSGMAVSPRTAMQLSAVFACVRVCAETLGSCPIVIYKELPDGGKERAPDHPLYNVLHSRPNIYQTPMEFVEMMQAHLDLRGNAFAYILPGPNGAVEELVPLHPDRVQVFRLPNRRLRYQVRSWFDGTVDNYPMESIFHLRGMSLDGIVGISPIAEQREVVGIGLAQQEYAARFFANDSQPRGILEHPASLSDEAYARLKKSFAEAQSGANRHKAAILEEGMKYNAIGLNNKDSQFLEARQFSRSDIAGFFRVPLHKIGDLTKSAFSNIEQQSIEFVTDNQRPRAVRWEHRINLDLIEPLQLADDESNYFAEFDLNALMRGDMQSRYQAYAIGRTGGWLSRNDIRRDENKNPIKNGDDYLTPLNMSTTGGPGPDPADTNLAEDANAEEAEAAARRFAIRAADRLVRRETTALRKIWNRTKATAAFDQEAGEFYGSHATLIADDLELSLRSATAYCKTNFERLKAAGEDVEDVLDEIAAKAPQALADLSRATIARAKLITGGKRR